LYYLSDYGGRENIKGGFYKFELTPVNITTFRIERIIRRRRGRGGKRFVFVKWLGYDNSHNSWIPEEDLQDIHNE